jgi:hypothetical protein
MKHKIVIEIPPYYIDTLHEATHKVGQLYGVPHGILKVFTTILYKNEFQNPQIFQQTISLLPAQSTLRYGQIFSK